MLRPGFKRWRKDRRVLIPETHEPGKQPGFMQGKRGLKKSRPPKKS